MSKHLALRAEPIDPEFAEAYEQAAEPSVQRKSHARPVGDHSEDELQAIARLAKANQAKALDRKQFADGSFDQIENDISNTLKLGWDILTR